MKTAIKKRFFAGAIAAVIMVGSIPLVSYSAQAQAYPEGFVYANGAKFVCDGSPYYYGGTNPSRRCRMFLTTPVIWDLRLSECGAISMLEERPTRSIKTALLYLRATTTETVKRTAFTSSIGMTRRADRL